MIRAGGEGGAGSRKQAHENGGRNIHSEWCALKHKNDIYYETYVLLIYTGGCRRIFEAGVAWSVNSPCEKTKWEDLRRTKRYDIMSAGRDVIARKHKDPLRNRITGYRGRKWHEDRCELRALSWDSQAVMGHTRSAGDRVVRCVGGARRARWWYAPGEGR